MKKTKFEVNNNSVYFTFKVPNTHSYCREFESRLYTKPLTDALINILKKRTGNSKWCFSRENCWLGPRANYFIKPSFFSSHCIYVEYDTIIDPKYEGITICFYKNYFKNDAIIKDILIELKPILNELFDIGKKTIEKIANEKRQREQYFQKTFE